jgi:LAS superfamily LD-carboxypeptidase LdcB
MEHAGGFVFAANCMFDDARRDGITLRAISEGYRSYERQLALFVDRYQDTPSGRKPEVVRYFEGKKYWLKPNKSPSATPGFSPHGFAVSQDYDVTAGDVFAWLRRNAPAYGIYLQGPPAYLGTGPNPEFEAWHWQLSTPTEPTAMIRRRWRKFVRALG